MLVLYDSRRDSLTNGLVNEIFMGGSHKSKLVQIPVGVWHGFKSLDSKAYLLHLNTIPYNPKSLDEDRLPFNHSSIP